MAFSLTGLPVAAQEFNAAASARDLSTFVQDHCVDCHDSATKTAGLNFDELLQSKVADNRPAWEKVLKKLDTRQMPPADMPRPATAEYTRTQTVLELALDAANKASPVTGRTESLRRLNRTEYGNAIRDLLGLEIDVTNLLPADESSQGFDNITVTSLSPTLMSRYIIAAQKISRLAVGNSEEGSLSENFRMRPDVTQDLHRVDGLPLGTRGGIQISYHFPKEGEYEIKVRLMRDRNDEIEGLRGKHELEVLVDRARKASFTVEPPPRGKSDEVVEAKLVSRIRVPAGAHDLAVTFVKKPFSLIESESQPLNVHYNFYRHPRLGPAVYQVSISGPFNATGKGKSPSKTQIFSVPPTKFKSETAKAEYILRRLSRLAYRRPVTNDNLNMSLGFFERGRKKGGFDAGMERALASILVNPNFLFRIEKDPDESKDGPYRISDLELASRLSFFIWSSIPDGELLDLAEKGELRQAGNLERQVRRMLADKRSRSLINNFADQWLYLRNLDSFVPDARLYPDFGHNLRQAFRRETELLFRDVLENDRNVMRLLDSESTYLNERLARHYGIPHVYGSHFRKVDLTGDARSQRGGILRHGSVLSVTSYATRTSPVLRGKWVLENVLGSPPPPPPPDVPDLEDNQIDAGLPVRERLAAHRESAACASCHALIDPIGFSFENYDAIGRWRVLEQGKPVDSQGGMPDGSRFIGVEGLESALLKRPRLFVGTMTEKLMTFALGRGVDYFDQPAVRKIVRDAESDDFRFSSLIVGIVKSEPFQTRMSETGQSRPEGGRVGRQNE